MKYSIILFAMMAIYFLLFCDDKEHEESTANTGSMISADSAKTIIMANNLRLGTMLKNGDTTGWAEMYTNDGCAYPSGMPKICGKPAISGFTGYAYRNLGYRDIKINTEEILPGNGFFVEVGTYEIFDSTGKSADKGKTMVVWKEENGSLKLHRDFFNTDLPPK